MRITVFLIALLGLAGCTMPGAGLFENKNHQAEREELDRYMKQGMKHKIKVKRPEQKESAAGVVPNVLEPVTVTTSREGVTASVPAGSELEIDTEANTEEDESTETESVTEAESQPTKKGLPWGVYVAVIGLVAGGVLLTFKAGPGWGLPLVAAGAAVYSIFMVINAYPGMVAIAIALAVVGAVGVYAYHGLSAVRRAQALKVLKQAVNEADSFVAEEMKAEIKKIAGSSTNPVRKALDAELEKV